MASTTADLEEYRDKLAGKIVILGAAHMPALSDKPLFTRANDADLAETAQYQSSGQPYQRDRS
jgi:hypothetical protein